MDKGTLNKIICFFRDQPVKRVWIFGSCARGEDLPDSDIDLLVDFDPEKHVGFFKFIEIRLKLEEFLSRKVDLLKSDGIMAFAKKSIDHDKILIYEK